MKGSSRYSFANLKEKAIYKANKRIKNNYRKLSFIKIVNKLMFKIDNKLMFNTEIDEICEKKQFRYLLHCHKYNIHGITLEINKKDTNK